MTEEKLHMSKDRITGKHIKCSKSSLQKLADWTKDMDDIQLDDFLQKIRNSKEGYFNPEDFFGMKIATLVDILATNAYQFLQFTYTIT